MRTSLSANCPKQKQHVPNHMTRPTAPLVSEMNEAGARAPTKWILDHAAVKTFGGGVGVYELQSDVQTVPPRSYVVERHLATVRRLR